MNSFKIDNHINENDPTKNLKTYLENLFQLVGLSDVSVKDYYLINQHFMNRIFGEGHYFTACNVEGLTFFVELQEMNGRNFYHEIRTNTSSSGLIDIKNLALTYQDIECLLIKLIVNKEKEIDVELEAFTQCHPHGLGEAEIKVFQRKSTQWKYLKLQKIVDLEAFVEEINLLKPYDLLKQEDIPFIKKFIYAGNAYEQENLPLILERFPKLVLLLDQEHDGDFSSNIEEISKLVGMAKRTNIWFKKHYENNYFFGGKLVSMNNEEEIKYEGYREFADILRSFNRLLKKSNFNARFYYFYTKEYVLFLTDEEKERIKNCQYLKVIEIEENI